MSSFGHLESPPLLVNEGGPLGIVIEEVWVKEKVVQCTGKCTNESELYANIVAIWQSVKLKIWMGGFNKRYSWGVQWCSCRWRGPWVRFNQMCTSSIATHSKEYWCTILWLVEASTIVILCENLEVQGIVFGDCCIVGHQGVFGFALHWISQTNSWQMASNFENPHSVYFIIMREYVGIVLRIFSKGMSLLIDKMWLL